MRRTVLIVVAMLGVASGVAGVPVAVAGDLAVPSSGVGTEVRDRELVGQADTFPEGREVVFWTLVEGGAEGDAIDHVWMRDGEEVVVIGLAVGGSRWRTWSRKTLHPGSAGAWAVEARDRDGNVLARETFACTAASEEPSSSARPETSAGS
jgi:hypothetical protein